MHIALLGRAPKSVMALPHGVVYHNPKQNMRSIVDSTSTPGSNDIASPTIALVKSAGRWLGKGRNKMFKKTV